jgi:hypothetical protein
MTVEGLKVIFDWIAVILLFLTFAAGVGVLITGNIINERQGQQLRQFDKDLTGAKTELSKQQERAADADARVAGLEQDAASAKTEMAKQQARAATAERILLELRQKIKGRTLTAEQKQEFIALTKNIPKGPLSVTAMDGDPESIAFAKQLVAMFKDAGWNPDFGSITLDLTVPSKAPVGQGSPLYHAAILEKALETIGFPTDTDENRDLKVGQAILVVGHKP